MEDQSKEVFIQIGHAIKAARKEQNLTMQDLSQKVGLSQSAISMIENGIRHPSIQTISKFSQALGVDFTKFFLEANLTQPTHAQDTPALHLETLDFKADLTISNFVCEYNDPDIQDAIYSRLTAYLKEKLLEKELQEEINILMKKIIQEKLDQKQSELQKLYNRVQH